MNLGMNYREQFGLVPGRRIQLQDFDPDYADHHGGKKDAHHALKKLKERMDEMQFQLYSEQNRSLLVCLQALDAGGKDGVIRHVMGAMNPQGCRVVGFKEPSSEALAHDFLWRIEHQAPRRGEVVVFNRSHYEDVLIARVHELVPESVWSKRYEQINHFESRLAESGTHILKFFLHISKDEQLERFKDRLDDPTRHWKISDADYSERKYWDDYEAAYDAVLSKCSTRHAPWFVIPSNRKWFRNLAIAQIIVETMDDLGIEVPEPTVDLDEIRSKYHATAKKSD